MCWLLFFSFLPFQDQAETYFQDGNYFEAEGHFLAMDPSADQVPLVGRRLAEIGLRVGSSSSKRTFYGEAASSREGTRRQVALFAKAGLDAYARDWRAFATTATTYLRDRGGNATTYGDYQILFYLARYTPIELSAPDLPSAAKRFFESCRALRDDQLLPSGNRSNPDEITLLAQLGELTAVAQPTVTANTTQVRYFQGLADIHNALNGNDLATAAATINRMFQMDRDVNRSDLRVLFYPLVMRFFRANDQVEKARVTEGNLLISRQWAVLPMEVFPEELAVPGEWSLDELDLDEAIAATEPAPPAETVSSSEDPSDDVTADAEPDVPVETAEVENVIEENTAVEDESVSQTAASGRDEPTENDVAPAISESEDASADILESDATSANEEAVATEQDTEESTADESTAAVDSEPNESELVEETATPIAEDETNKSTEETPAEADLPESPEADLPITPAMPRVDFQSAKREFEADQYYGAEGYLLAGDPAREDIVSIAFMLVEIALRIGNADSKTNFYERYLGRSRNWRGAASLILSALAVHQRDWSRLKRYGTIFFDENRDLRDPRLHRLLFYLARYTDADELNLETGYAGWFQAFRQTPTNRLFPPKASIPTSAGGFPDYLTHLSLLDEQNTFALPPTSAAGSTDGAYVQGLFAIRKALNESDDATAARTINAVRATQMPTQDLEIYLLPLMAEFFESRDMPDRAARTRDRERALRRQSVMMPALLPEAVRAPEVAPVTNVDIAADASNDSASQAPQPTSEPVIASTEEPAESKEPAPTTVQNEEQATDDSLAAEAQPVPRETEATAVTNKPESSTGGGGAESTNRPVTPGHSFEDLEKQLRRDYRGLELTIRGKKADTAYKRIYRNYLLGSYYLAAKRNDAAFEQLSLAARLIVDFPFPALEMKIKVALADYFERQNNTSREDWYRISAIQIWGAPEHLSIMTDPIAGVQDSPYEPLIDQVLEISKAGADLSQVIFFSEADHFHKLRKLAFQRGALTDNAILDFQLRQVGDQLKTLVRDLAENPNAEPSPKRYNDTLTIWNRLWTQTLPFYQQMETPDLKAVQAKLVGGARLLRFVEGRSQIGLMVITQDQAFSIGLGSKAAFRAMSTTRRFEELEGHLGPVWNESRLMHVVLSPTLEQESFVRQLRSRMRRPALLRLHFSLRAFANEQQPASCRKVAVLSEDRSPELSRFVQTLPQAGLTWLDSSRFQPRRLDVALEDHDRLIVVNTPRMKDDGLHIDMGDKGFYLHEIVHYNHELCSLALVAPNWQDSGKFLSELELIDPSGRVGIHILENMDQLSKVPFEVQYQGVVLPKP